MIRQSLIAAITTIFLTACEGHGNHTADIAPRDTSAYNIGRERAAYLTDSCQTENEVRRQLLDMQALETDIRTRVSPAAAAAYREEIRTYLTERGDTLATTLF